MRRHSGLTASVRFLLPKGRALQPYERRNGRYGALIPPALGS